MSLHRSAVLAATTLLMAAAPVAQAAPVHRAAPPPTGPVPFSVSAKGVTTPISGVRTKNDNLIIRKGGTTSRPAKAAPGVATHKLTVEYLDDTGQPAAVAGSSVLNLTGQEDFQDVPRTDGLGQIELPTGRYLLGGQITAAGADTLFFEPVVNLTADQTIVLDARQGKAVEQRPANRTVRPFFAEAVMASKLDTGYWGSMSLQGKDLATMRVAAVGEAAPADQAFSWVTSQWAVPGPAGDFANSPLHYGLTDTHRGSMFNGLHRVATDGQLAKLVSKHYEQAPRAQGRKGFSAVPPGLLSSDGVSTAVGGTSTVTSYLEPGADWYPNFIEYPTDGPPCLLNSESTTAYQAGKTYVQEWKKGVLGPVADHSTFRIGDRMLVGQSLVGDSAGHTMQALGATGNARLFRDGSLVAESDQPGYFPAVAGLPGGDAQYRYEANEDRSGFSGLSRQVEASWTFHSKTTATDESLPMWAVRFSPDVDRKNSVAATSRLTIPLHLEVDKGAKVGSPAVPVVEVSGNSGKTWQRAVVVPTGTRKYVATVAVPAGAKEISLRTSAHDSLGNTVDETVVGAFTLR